MQNTTTTLPSFEAFKSEAMQLKKDDDTLSNHMTALNLTAEKYGYRNWPTIRPLLRTRTELQDDSFNKLTKIGKELAENTFWIGLALKENKKSPYSKTHDHETIVSRAKESYHAIQGIFVEAEKLKIIEIKTRV